MQFASRQLQNESKRCETKQKAEEKKVVEALQKGQTEVARIYASNAVREKTQSINFLKLASRMDAVCGRVENAIRMKTVRLRPVGAAVQAGGGGWARRPRGYGCSPCLPTSAWWGRALR